MSFRSLFLASMLVVAAIAVGVGQTGAVGQEVTLDRSGETDVASQTQVNNTTQPQINNSTIFRRVEAEGSSFVVEMNMSMLTSMFQKGSTFRIVTGGTVEGNRVVWFDIGIGYSGGAVLGNPLDEFVVRSEMWMEFPGFG